MSHTSDRTVEFLSLYNREQREIYVYIRSLLFRQQDAEEVFQETCIALWEHFDQFQSGTNFRAWARQIARYRVLAFCKKRRQEEALVFNNDVLELIADTVDQNPTASEARQAALRECCKKLSREDQALIEQRYARRITTVRVAADLGRPLNTVYKALQRIRRGLRECIERSLARTRTLDAEA